VPSQSTSRATSPFVFSFFSVSSHVSPFPVLKVDRRQAPVPQNSWSAHLHRTLKAFSCVCPIFETRMTPLLARTTSLASRVSFREYDPPLFLVHKFIAKQSTNWWKLKGTCFNAYLGAYMLIITTRNIVTRLQDIINKLATCRPVPLATSPPCPSPSSISEVHFQSLSIPGRLAASPLRRLPR
jgi:hypothetical protein